MTRDELIEKVVNAIIKNPPNRIRVRDAGFLEYTDTIDHTPTAVALINTIFDALKEPTEEMAKAWAYAQTPPSTRTDWQAMLNASPLAREGDDVRKNLQ